MVISFINEKRALFKNIMAFIKGQRLEGDYLEFGVWKGKTIMTAYLMAEMEGIKIKFIGFDSFQGLPHSEGPYYKGEFKCTVEELKENLRVANIEGIEIVEGWFEDTLKDRPIGKVAAAFIDCDLYSSAKEALDYITPGIQDGTVIMFDEWFAHRANPEMGEHKAFDEWIKKNNFKYTEYRKFAPLGCSFIIRR